jgi:hypothetical protein
MRFKGCGMFLSDTFIAVLGMLGVLNCLFVFALGGAAERIGAGVILTNLLAGFANDLLMHPQLAQLLELCIDGVTALILLGITVRYASFWLGAVMLLYGLQFGLHAYYAVLERQRDFLHLVLNDADFIAVNLAMTAGTLMAWRRRHRLATAGPASAGSAP